MAVPDFCPCATLPQRERRHADTSIGHRSYDRSGCGGVQPGFAEPARDLGPRDELRKLLLDVLRPIIVRDLDQEEEIRFVVQTMRVQDRWAWIVARPQTASGRPINLEETRYAPQVREGMMDGDTIYALLEHNPYAWVVKDFVIGPTDVAWEDWPQRYGAPRELLGLGG